ncbi:hypothetical protein B0H66DRAFT_555913 [Apodospora peruviana]|uniref:NmrA-like domain-containing protein n=1 Tax=Apodospora peruviana TaxID=516989 RepID=A0AAE0I3N8_9PEZI|nr:hypothetical protein B0H66DRAFT_555913 [Apodospora peruviana]
MTVMILSVDTKKVEICVYKGAGQSGLVDSDSHNNHWQLNAFSRTKQTNNMSTPLKVFVIGGTGAQGMPVVRGLAQDGKYAVRVLTRDTTSRRARELAAIGPNVELVPGTFMSEATLRAGFAGCWGAFINIDGFATGEAMETYWTIRCYELAIDCGLRFYVHGNLDYSTKLGGYDPKFRGGHYDGKGRMGEWIQMQNASNKGKPWYKMQIALFTTGPYIEMALCQHTPLQPKIEQDEATGEEVVTWRLPLTPNGAIPHVALDDCAHYVRWLFDNPDRADGMDLMASMDHIHYDDVAVAFEKVTGRKARFVDVTMDEYWRDPYWASIADRPCGYMVDPESPAKMTNRENFTGWWSMWQVSGRNQEPCKRDYALLDDIFPGRIRTAEEFFRREDEKRRKAGGGSLWDVVVNPKPILKIHEDGQILQGKRKEKGNVGV